MRQKQLSTALIALAAMFSCAFAQEIVIAPTARVLGLEPATIADLVVLDGGFDAGLRQGMICRVVRSGIDIADLVLVEVRPAYSTAILLSVAPGRSVRSGDIARVKTLQS